MKAEFSDETLTEECTWQTVVLIPKGTSGKFRAIGLVEVLWKAVTSLLNRRFTSDITLHDVLHRFGVGYGLGNAVIEANLLQQLTAMREEVLFEVFLDLQKAYDALDWDRCLVIIAAHGVDPRTIRLLWN